MGIGTNSPSDKLEINGNLRFTQANPVVTAPSYLVIPGGAYFSNGTVYMANQMQARGGVNNDLGTLALTGSNNVVNVASSYLMVAGKYAIDGTDGYLRLNQQNSFVNGIYTPYVLRADGALLTLGKIGVGTTTPTNSLQVMEFSSGTSATLSENKYTGNADGRGITGNSINNPGWGYGGFFEGGYIGVRADATASSYAGTAYGVYGNTTGSNGTRIGVFGAASGGVTNYGLYCNGNGVYTNSWSMVSDQKLKDDIKPLTGALEKIMRLNPKTYYFKTKEYPFMNLPERQQIGLIAQEVEKVFPGLVEDAKHPGDDGKSHAVKNEISFKSMNYIGLTPILVQAIKEQQQIIENQQQRIAKLESEIISMHEDIVSLKSMCDR